MSLCDCGHTSHESFEGVYFKVAADVRSGVYNDWLHKPTYAEEHIPYSNRAIVELIGWKPATLEWELSFCCSDAFHELMALQGTVGTLTCFAGYQSAKGTQVSLGNPVKVYERLDEVLLKSLDNPVRMVGGEITVTATFQRAMDPVSRLAVVE